MSPDAAWTTGRLAELVGATCEGDPDRPIRGVAALETADSGELAFCTGGRWRAALGDTRAGAVLVSDLHPPDGVIALRHPDPRSAYAVAATALHPLDWPLPGVHPRAWVAEDAVVEGATIDAFAVVEAGALVAAGAWVQPHAYVGRGARIGARSRLMPSAVVMDRCVLGEGVWLKPGAVVGAPGFGYAPGPDGPMRIPQLGIAVLEDDVDVGANACVDRAALGETRVGRGSRLDNLVQVAHGVRVGAGSLLAAFAGVAGGARLGRGVVLGGRAAVTEGVDVGEHAVLAALASVAKHVAPGSRIGGSPGRPHRKWLREMAALRRLPDLLRQVAGLMRRAETDDRTEP